MITPKELAQKVFDIRHHIETEEPYYHSGLQSFLTKMIFTDEELLEFHMTWFS